MALHTDGGSEIPKGAVRLSKREALEYQYSILQNWRRKRDVHALNHGSLFLGAAAMPSGAYIHAHFREYMRLGVFGRYPSYIPIVLLPAVFCHVAHKIFVTEPLLLKKFTCPTCLEMRSAAIQLSIATLYPSILSPIVCFAMAGRFHTFDVPIPYEEPKKAMNLLWKIMKSGKSVYTHVILTNMAAAMIITFLETNAMIKVNETLLELERKAEEELLK